MKITIDSIEFMRIATEIAKLANVEKGDIPFTFEHVELNFMFLDPANGQKPGLVYRTLLRSRDKLNYDIVCDSMSSHEESLEMMIKKCLEKAGNDYKYPPQSKILS